MENKSKSSNDNPVIPEKLTKVCGYGRETYCRESTSCDCPESNPVIEQKDDIIKFLCGESSFNGVWFGDENPNEPHFGKFWWRTYLRKYAESRQLTTTLELLKSQIEKEKTCRGVHGHYADGRTWAFNRVLELIESLPNLTPNDGWISVKEYVEERIKFVESCSPPDDHWQARKEGGLHELNKILEVFSLPKPPQQ